MASLSGRGAANQEEILAGHVRNRPTMPSRCFPSRPRGFRRRASGAAELSLAFTCLAAAHATFMLPEALGGGFPGACGPSASRLVGARVPSSSSAPAAISTRRRWSLGLVLAVSPADRLRAESHALARHRRGGPIAPRGAKRIMNARRAEGFAAARMLSDTLRHALEWSQDVDEGMAAHREGRPPRFTGR